MSAVGRDSVNVANCPPASRLAVVIVPIWVPAALKIRNSPRACPEKRAVPMASMLTEETGVAKLMRSRFVNKIRHQ